MTTTNLDLQAREIFFSALSAADARRATRRALTLSNSLLSVGDIAIDIAERPVYVVAIGKAAMAMTAGLRDVLGDRISNGIVCGPAVGEVDFGWPAFAGGHPLPTEDSIAAARATVSLLTAAESSALIIFLISGGGSAMFELATDESISIADLREANRQLVSSGASIAEVNAVRRAFSAVKGGKLARYAPNTDQITLIVSDTNPDDVASVASGPSLEPNASAPEALKVVQSYDLVNSLPASILKAIEQPAQPLEERASGLRVHHVLLDNRRVLEAAAAEAGARGFAVEIVPDINEQEIEVGSDLLISRAQTLWQQHGGKPVCLVSGGEFSCPVRGSGIGGRNLETVLRCAMKLEEMADAPTNPHWALLSAGTDGVDGNSLAAGAWADESTIRLGLSQGLGAADFLERSDAFHFFEHLGNLIVTGPTGTNVRDVRIVLAGPRASSA